ncbi:MAG: Bax inhibitor-1/YccA family protein, partial [Pseudooceanicola nanhaiensis]
MAEPRTIRQTTGVRGAAVVDEGLRAHMNKVYGTMSVGMLLTFLVAWAVGTSPDLLAVFRDPQTLQPNILGWIVMFAPLIMVFAFGAAINRLSAAGAQLFFYAFAAVMGLSLSWIFVAFTGMSIAQVFLVTSIAFAGLSLWGYTTKKDISGWGAFLIMGVIGILVASI